MGAFDRLRAIGEWWSNRPVTKAEWEAIDALRPAVLNGLDGSTHEPSGPIIVGGAGFQSPTVPATGNALTNKTYVDAAQAAAEATAAAALAAFITQGSYSPTFSSESGLSGSPTTVHGYWVKVGDTIMVWANFNVSVTGDVSRSFRVSLPVDPGANFSTANQCFGHVSAHGGLAFGQGHVANISGTKLANIAFDDPISGSTSGFVHASFWYKMLA